MKTIRQIMIDKDCSEVEAIRIYNSAIDAKPLKKSANIRIEVLKGIVNKMNEFRSAEDLFSVARSREEKCISKNLTFWQAICDSLWFLYKKRRECAATSFTVRERRDKPNLRIQIVKDLANNIEKFDSADEMFAVPRSRTEKGIKQNLSFWRVICDSLWSVYHEEIKQERRR